MLDVNFGDMPPFYLGHFIRSCPCGCPITYSVNVTGLEAKVCTGAHLLTTGSKGLSAVFNFSKEWDEVPYRTAVFWAKDICESVPLEGNQAVMPDIVFSKPYADLLVCVCGADCIPDPESIARAEEICARQSEINMEFRECEQSEVKALMDEYIALANERKGLNLIRKRYITQWCELGYIYPGTTLPDARG